MTQTILRGQRQRLVSVPPALIGRCEPIAQSAGLTIGEWVRSLMRREIARVEGEKVKEK